MRKLSLLCPRELDVSFHPLPAETINDLSVEQICALITEDKKEQNIFKNFMISMTDNARVSRYRSDIFQDIMNNPSLRTSLLELLEKVNFLESYKGFHEETDTASVWDLVHRLSEIRDYIVCVDDISACLSNADLHSEGLLGLCDYVHSLYDAEGFDALREDTAKLSRDINQIKSVTLGVNINDRFEPNGVGIVSVNEKPFTKTGVLSHFCDFLTRGDAISKGTGPENPRTFRTYMEGPDDILPRFNQESSSDSPLQILDRITSHMLSSTVKKLKTVLSRHVDVSIYELSSIIPEFLYYVRWADWVETRIKEGYSFCKPEILDAPLRSMTAEGIYNLKLVKNPPETIVPNDVDFCPERRLYILTGANRGGKTTLTQGIALAFWLAQNGIYVPAKRFAFSPADNIFTHFPADENKTVDFGRLGEESKRFRDLYLTATDRSLILLNESFSTTSFEEGFYIAYDALKALKVLGARTIFNSHMHKLAENLEDFNASLPGDSKAASMIMAMEGTNRSYKVLLAPPEGQSYARDIAEKYGVTFEQLCGKI